MAKQNPFGNVPGLGNMVKQVQKMQEDTVRVEEELKNERIEGTSGGGMVKTVANGHGEVLEIKIDSQVVDPEDVEMLEDLVISAVRDALEKSSELKQAKLQEITGGLSLPPGLF